MRLTPLCAPSLVFGSMLLLASNTLMGAIGSAFTYQGRLTDGGDAANGTYDLRFSLYDAAAGGGQVGLAVTNTSMAVSNGTFTVLLDFGASAFDGAARWLEVAVRQGTNDFTVTSPRQPVTPTPYAITATALAGPLPESQLPSGVARLSDHQTFTGSNTFSGVVTAGNPANEFAGRFQGDGSGLTNLDSSLARLPEDQIFTGSNTFSGVVTAGNPANDFAGRFHGDASGLTNLDTSAVAAATNDLNTALSARIVAATNAGWIASTNLVVAATNDLNAGVSAQIVAATNAPWIASTSSLVVATNDLNTALSARITGSTNDLLTTSNSYHGRFIGNGAWLTNLVTTKIVGGSGIGITTNDNGQMSESITITYTGAGGSATNAVSSIWTNGQPVAPLATNLNLIPGANVTLAASNYNYGRVDITIHSNPQTNDLNTALVAKITASTNDLGAVLSAQIVAATNAPWIASTNLVLAATNALNTALSAKVVAATNAPWIASTNLVATATNALNTALSARIVAATNAPWIASTNLVATATNDLNAVLSAKVVTATNALWVASTNWVVAQGYAATNGLTRKMISYPAPSDGTNYVVDFGTEVVQVLATNHITLVQSTNRPGPGWYGECVWYIQGGAAEWTLRVNPNWNGVGTLAASTPYVITSNKLTMVAFSARGSNETNVTYAIGRQE
jgi:hypothetical protein